MRFEVGFGCLERLVSCINFNVCTACAYTATCLAIGDLYYTPHYIQSLTWPLTLLPLANELIS